MAKSKMTINKEILIGQCRDVIDVIMQIGGGLMPRTMLVAIAELPRYKDKKLLSQLALLTKPQRHVMRDNTIKEYPPFLQSNRLNNYVIYTVSLANARLINPVTSYTQPSLDASALVRRLQQIHHRISILRDYPRFAIEQLYTIASGLLAKKDLPQYLLDLAKRVGNGRDKLLVAEANYTQNALDRMAGGRKGDLPDKMPRDDAFVMLKSPTILALHQMGVYVQLVTNDSYRICIYEGRKLRGIDDIIKLIGDAAAYFGMLLPSNFCCKEILVKTVDCDGERRLRKMIGARGSVVRGIMSTNDIKEFNLSSTNILDNYFGGIML